MYHHVKKLMYDVNVGEPDPRFGSLAARTANSPRPCNTPSGLEL
jgi:hypothetical protein